MSILDEVNVPHLDQFYGWQCLASLSRPGDAQPAALGVILEWVEVAVKVVATTPAATDLPDRHRLYPGTAESGARAGGIDLGQREQVA